MVAITLYIEQYPIIDIKGTAQKLNLHYNTVSNVVLKLMDLGILKEVTNAARNRVLIYEQYLAILREWT